MKIEERLEPCVYKPRNAMDCQQLSEAKRETERVSPQNFQKEPSTLPTPRFWTSSFNDYEKINFCYSDLPGINSRRFSTFIIYNDAFFF